MNDEDRIEANILDLPNEVSATKENHLLKTKNSLSEGSLLPRGQARSYCKISY